MVVDVLFLCLVDAHEHLDRFDDALPISDKIPVRLFDRHPCPKVSGTMLHKSDLIHSRVP